MKKNQKNFAKNLVSPKKSCTFAASNKNSVGGYTHKAAYNKADFLLSGT